MVKTTYYERSHRLICQTKKGREKQERQREEYRREHGIRC